MRREKSKSKATRSWRRTPRVAGPARREGGLAGRAGAEKGGKVKEQRIQPRLLMALPLSFFFLFFFFCALLCLAAECSACERAR